MKSSIPILRSAMLIILVLFFLATTVAGSSQYRPVVLLHGLFSSKEGMSHIEGWLKQDYPGIYIHNAEIGDGKWDSLLIDLNTQVQMFTEQIQRDGNLSAGFDLIAHSQGGLVTRGFIERFNSPPVHNYISLAGPHAGVFGIPDLNDWCPDVDCPWIAELFSKISEGGWIEPWMQKYVSFAQYWKNPFNYSAYLDASSFLADVNNERAIKNSTYRQHMLQLNKAVLVRAEQDHIVVPKQSPWFVFYNLGQDSSLDSFTTSVGYKGDWLGLKTLNEQGKVALEAVNCTHQNLPRLACKTAVYDGIIKQWVGGRL